MRYLRTLSILSLIFIFSGLSAADFVKGQVLVKLQPDVSRQEFSAVLDNNDYIIEKTVVRRLNIVLVRIVNPQIATLAAVAELRANPWVEKAQPDHKIEQRETFPNDTEFDDQWDMHNTGQTGGLIDADIDAPEAWDITTGGVTPLGDTIVVAVVDGGCDLNHSDLVPNLWINRNEIPGNNIDDDSNGYVDDVNGWNAYNSNGTISSDGHGTHVSGTVGARGNNNSGVTGVNWRVKIMPIAGSTGTTSIALEAYGYALDQRVAYDSSNGQMGAFVVATNSSFGVNYGDCTDNNFSLWNDMYDAMGTVGILSAAATMNINADVDVSGDVPTGCDSDFMVAVTNTTDDDVRNSGAAYGLTTIDLGAPGTNILSTYPGGGTTTMTGTSMATPHVAGAIGFIHAAMSQGFAQYYKANPAEAAVELKTLLLDGTDPITSLESNTVSGGRLNIYNTALLVQSYLASDSLDPNPVTNLVADTHNYYEIALSWEDPTTLFGGDPLGAFAIDISKNGEAARTIAQGVESWTDGLLPGGTTHTYDLVTRVLASDSISTTVSITATVAGDEFIPGDVNHDGTVNVTDVVRLLHFTLGYATPNDLDFQTADTDHNGELDIIDVLTVVDIILGRI